MKMGETLATLGSALYSKLTEQINLATKLIVIMTIYEFSLVES